MSTDRLVELVWREDERPEREVAAVQTYVSRLRAALGAGDVLTRLGTGYLVRVAPTQLDAARFAALVAEARGEAADDHRRALSDPRAYRLEYHLESGPGWVTTRLAVRLHDGADDGHLAVSDGVNATPSRRRPGRRPARGRWRSEGRAP